MAVVTYWNMMCHACSNGLFVSVDILIHGFPLCSSLEQLNHTGLLLSFYTSWTQVGHILRHRHALTYILTCIYKYEIKHNALAFTPDAVFNSFNLTTLPPEPKDPKWHNTDAPGRPQSRKQRQRMQLEFHYTSLWCSGGQESYEAQITYRCLSDFSKSGDKWEEKSI